MSIACDIRLSGSSAARPRPAASPSTGRQCVIIEFPAPVAASRSAPAAVRHPRRTDRHSLRLTRRGRRLAASAIGAVVIGSLGIGVHALAGDPVGMAPASSTAVVVRTGDTLWSIAHTVAPDSDARAVVAALRARNHLSSASLRPGQRLVVPRDVP